MPPKRKIPPTEDQLGPNKASTKTQLREELFAHFGDLKSVQFKPFQPEKDRPAKALLPSTFSTQPIPSDYFNLFFTSDLFDLIVRNTNKYASIQRLNKAERAREWHELNTAELRVFIGVIIYMGVHYEPETTWYWNTDLAKGPIHSIPSYLHLHRFQQIKRYLWRPEQTIIQCLYKDTKLRRKAEDGRNASYIYWLRGHVTRHLGI
jgi:hypothetical protein